jgi:hypothetical protein
MPPGSSKDEVPRMSALLSLDRLHKALRWLVDASAIIVFVFYMVVISVAALIEGGSVINDWKNGLFGYLLFYAFVMPFFLIQATYFVFCKVAGIETNFDVRLMLYLSLAPLAGILIASLKAENLGEATYWGLFICLLVGSFCIFLWNLSVLGRMIWRWLSAGRRKTPS